MDTETVPPDTKDWTWVLDRRCDECGFDPATVDRATLPDRIEATAAGWPELLAGPEARVRPSMSVWSPTEYGAHVRDVAHVMGGRLQLMLGQDDPLFPNWDQDDAAIQGHYAGADPGAVAGELVAALAAFAAAYRTVTDADWDRPGRRSNGSVFTIFTLGIYALHDLEHHRHDVGLAG